MNYERLNAYRIMWLFVIYDLPMVSEADKKRYTAFRKKIIKDGFQQFQFSMYIRHCSSVENMEVHKQRVKNILPSKGHICIMHLTDKQFGMMEIFIGKKPDDPPPTVQQLELF